MSNSTFQSLLMESGGSLEPDVPTCVADPYYTCGPTNDPYWASVVLMLHMDGANGSTTFTDSSTANETMLASGSAALSTAEKKFGTASLALNGTTDYIYADAANTNYDLGSSFTVEAWVYSTEAGRRQFIIGNKNIAGTRGFELYKNTFNRLTFVRWTGTGSAISTTSGSLTIPTNQWVHVAVSRQALGASNLIRLFINGQTEGFISGTTSIGASTGVLMVGADPSASGREFAGYIDEVRITRNVGRYWGAYTIPTEAFPNALDSDFDPDAPRTVLSLHCEPNLEVATSNTFDSEAVSLTSKITLSNDNKTATNVDGTLAAAVASRSRRYGKYYWEATPTNIVSANWIGWVSRAVAEDPSWSGSISPSTSGGFFINPSDSAPNTGLSVLGTSIATFPGGDSNDVFSFAVDLTVRPVKIAVALNGVWQFGDDPGNGVITYGGNISPGYPAISISGIGTSTTIALSENEFQYPMPTGYTAWATTENGANDEFPTEDSSCYNAKTVTVGGTAAVSATQAKFGSSSFEVINTGVSNANRVIISKHQDLIMFAGDWTLEMWVYRLANTYQGRLFSGLDTSSMIASVGTDGLLDVTYATSGGTQVRTNLGTVPTGQWCFLVFQRRSDFFETYIDGVRVDNVAVTSAGTMDDVDFAFYIGGTASNISTNWNGYFDEIRLTKGVARYTADFDVATLPNCDSTSAGGILPTSGTEYPSGETATVQTGQITLANHYQPLVGNSTLVRQGGVGLTQYPLPSGNTATYTVTKTLASSAATTTTVQGRLTWGTDGTFTFVNPENGVGTTTTWLSPTGAGASDEYELRLEIIDNPNNVVTPYSLPFEQYNEVVIDQIIPAYTDITLTEDEGSKTHTLQLQVDIKPKTGSAVAGQPGYVDSWLLTLNFLLTKPAIPTPVYPDFDSGTKVNSESGNVFTWYFNPNGTITSGAINGAQVGRWIDAFDDVAKASEYRLVVYSDPLPGGFQRVSPTTLIGANIGTPARVRHVNSGAVGSELYVGFTLRIYPLPTNPRYSEANYFGQYTFTMVIPQISGL